MRVQGPLPDRYTETAPEDLASWIGSAKAALGDRLLILGHHYQREEVMRWADARGDSFGLSRLAADNDRAEYVVFCGVHFMAESADILTGPQQKVVLPDLNAGCSMADMADIESVEEAWDALDAVIDIERLVPITYMNSSAALKAFVGRNGGGRRVVNFSFLALARHVCLLSLAREAAPALAQGPVTRTSPSQTTCRKTPCYDPP